MSDAVSAVLTSAPYLLEGMCVTLALVALALLIGFLCGIVLTIGQVCRISVPDLPRCH